jgi:hypothetical protein
VRRKYCTTVKELELRFLRGVLRVYSWIFETLLCLLGIGVAIVSLTVGAASPVHIDWLPWTPAALPGWLIGLGILGLIFVVLSILGRMRILFFLFAAAVFALIAKGFFFSTNSFEGPNEAKTALWLVIGSLIAIIGAWPSSGRGRDYSTR